MHKALNSIFDALNYTFMNTKHCINSKRSNSQNLLFIEFICMLKKCQKLIQIEEGTCNMIADKVWKKLAFYWMLLLKTFLLEIIYPCHTFDSLMSVVLHFSLCVCHVLYMYVLLVLLNVPTNYQNLTPYSFRQKAGARF